VFGFSSFTQGFPPVFMVSLAGRFGHPKYFLPFSTLSQFKRGSSCMKTLRFISTLAMLALATVVTAGSMYVTASAAAQQEATDEFSTAPAAPVPLQTAPAAGDIAQVPDVEAALEKLDAALDKNQILRGYQSHVILDDKGGFAGRLSSLRNSDGEPVPVANLQVRLAQHGAVIGSTTTDANGRFSFTGLPDGVVAIWAEGENTLMLFSVVLFGQNTAVAENAGLHAAQLELDMDSAVSSGSDIATVKELLSPYLNIDAKRFGDAVTSEDEEFSFGSGEAATTIHNHRVRLLNDGTLRGEINLLDERTGRVREVLDLTVHFVRNGVRIASSEVSNDGGFLASGLTPGVHSIVVVGQDGVMVSSVDLVGSNYEGSQAQGAGVGEFTPVRTIATSLILAGGYGGSPVGTANAGAFGGTSGSGGTGQTVLGSAPPAGGPYANGAGSGGGSGGGFGGGGGGFGGGGGLGALLAGGIGGAIGYLAGNNNNDSPASPGI
jgi:hypothetical protein